MLQSPTRSAGFFIQNDHSFDNQSFGNNHNSTDQSFEDDQFFEDDRTMTGNERCIERSPTCTEGKWVWGWFELPIEPMLLSSPYSQIDDSLPPLCWLICSGSDGMHTNATMQHMKTLLDNDIISLLRFNAMYYLEFRKCPPYCALPCCGHSPSSCPRCAAPSRSPPCCWNPPPCSHGWLLYVKFLLHCHPGHRYLPLVAFTVVASIVVITLFLLFFLTPTIYGQWLLLLANRFGGSGTYIRGFATWWY